ncbi:MAG: glycosyltransferase family 2 protein, partial [Acidobacteriota bacterium]
MTPQVSVVIPAYNRAALLPQAIQSVLAQTFTDFEIIVVDDGSTDGTEACLKPFGGRIRYLRQENVGPASARNRGIRASRSPLVGFLDSDDAWESRTLESVVDVFQQHPNVGLVSIMARETDPHGEETPRVYGKKSAGTGYSTSSLLGPDSGGCSWFFVRRPLLL